MLVVLFPTDVEDKIHCMVATHSNTLHVYSDVTLKWAAQLEKVPVQIAIANFM